MSSIGQHKWASAYLVACQRIYILYYLFYISLANKNCCCCCCCCFYSNAAACAKQRLSDTEKVKPRDGAADDDDDDDVDVASCAMMHTTLTLLLRYQRLLVSQFITTDKLRKMDSVLSPSGISRISYKKLIDVTHAQESCTRNLHQIECSLFSSSLWYQKLSSTADQSNRTIIIGAIVFIYHLSASSLPSQTY